jgi:uncharacterized protein (TIGR00290 family)
MSGDIKGFLFFGPRKERSMQEKVAACSWSSGKDSCLALYRALQDGYKIKYLFNFISAEYKRVSFHGAKSELVKLQSESIGIPLLQRETSRTNYEEIFRKTLRELKERKINQIVRGDIHLLDLQDWVETICQSESIKVISPIWQNPTEGLLREFITRGFKAVITSTQDGKLNQDWLGRIIDEKFISDLKATENVDLCGENGEYHSFVFDGPIFKKGVKILKTDKILRDGYWFLDIQDYRLEEKQ